MVVGLRLISAGAWSEVLSDTPNLLFVFGDQWRQQALGCMGDPNVRTPRIDAFADESANCVNATSGYPVCCPWRASLLTGQYPLTHGMIVNDQSIRSSHVSIADAFNAAGYHTGWIGKWHVDGHGRTACVPPERREGFAFWRGFECCHDYNHSFYWDDDGRKHQWEGYDAEAQTRMACDYLAERRRDRAPFAMFISWGPPHNPYQTAPARFGALYDPARLTLRPNVPVERHDAIRADLAGYYAHCTALDECFGQLLDQLAGLGLDDNTIVVFTSDHGDMLGSHGLNRKQHPHAESINVPLLVRLPAGRGNAGGRKVDSLLGAADMMPTLLGLCGVPIPDTVEGVDFSPAIRGERDVDDGGVLLACYRPFHEIHYRKGFHEYRGLRTARHTYVRHLTGPQLLFDNIADPYQLRNLAAEPGHAGTIRELDQMLQRKLDRLGDRFESGHDLARRYNIRLNELDDVVIVP